MNRYDFIEYEVDGSEIKETPDGDYVLRQDVVNMVQEIRRATNYRDYAEKIQEVLSLEGL